MQKGPFNPHFKKFFLCCAALPVEWVDFRNVYFRQKKVLHYIHDFINCSSVKEDYLFDILRLSGHNLFPQM